MAPVLHRAAINSSSSRSSSHSSSHSSNNCISYIFPPFPQIDSARSNGDCLEGKRGNYQVCSVQYCVQQLYTVNCTHI